MNKKILFLTLLIGVSCSYTMEEDNSKTIPATTMQALETTKSELIKEYCTSCQELIDYNKMVKKLIVNLRDGYDSGDEIPDNIIKPMEALSTFNNSITDKYYLAIQRIQQIQKDESEIAKGLSEK
jgi:hypothetical protein